MYGQGASAHCQCVVDGGAGLTPRSPPPPPPQPCTLQLSPSPVSLLMPFPLPLLLKTSSPVLSALPPPFAAMQVNAAGQLVSLAGSIAGLAPIITVLHPRYRPRARRVFHVPTSAGGARVDVLPSGEVQLRTAFTDCLAWLLLNRIQFFAEGGALDGTPSAGGGELVLQAPWASYGHGHQPASWWAHGWRVTLGGVVANASRDVPIARLPSRARPGTPQVYWVRSDTGSVQVTVDARGKVQWTAGRTDQWLSLDGVAFDVRRGTPLPLAPGAAPDPANPPQILCSESPAEPIALVGLVRVPVHATHVATVAPHAPRRPLRVFSAGNASLEVTIDTDGRVTVPQGSGGHWLSLDGIGYYAACFRRSDACVGDAHTVWRRENSTRDECRSACERFRCRSFVWAPGGSCALKARDPMTAPPGALSECSGAQGYTDTCPLSHDAWQWLSPAPAIPFHNATPRLTLATSLPSFAEVEVSGPVEHCFWHWDAVQRYDAALLPRMAAVADALSYGFLAIGAVFCCGAACQAWQTGAAARCTRVLRSVCRPAPPAPRQGARPDPAPTGVGPTTLCLWLHRAAGLLGVLVWLLQLALCGLLAVFHHSVTPPAPPIDMYWFIPLLPWATLLCGISLVLDHLGLPLRLPAYGFWRVVVALGGTLGFLGGLQAAVQSYIFAEVLTGQMTRGNRQGSLLGAFWSAFFLGITAFTAFKTWCALLLTAAVTLAWFLPLYESRAQFNYGGAAGIFMPCAMWQGMLLGVGGSAVLSFLARIRRLPPDGPAVAGMQLRWGWSPRPGHAPHGLAGPLRAGRALRRLNAVLRRHRVAVAWLKKCGGTALTAAALACTGFLAYQWEAALVPRIVVAWHQLLLECHAGGVVVVTGLYMALMLVLAWAVALVGWYRQQLHRGLVFLPFGAACRILLLAAPMAGGLAGVAWRVVAHGVGLYRHGQLSFCGLRQNNLVPAENRALYLLYFAVAVALGCAMGLLLWLHARRVTLLHLAAGAGWCPAPLVRLLVVIGSEGVHARTDGGRTALHLAARSGRPAVVRALLASGASPTFRDLRNDTPIHAAAARGDAVPTLWPLVEAAAQAMDAEALELTLCALNCAGQSALHVALLRQGAPRCRVAVEALLSGLGMPGAAEAQVRTPNGNGATALHVALERRLNKGADLMEVLYRHVDLGDVTLRNAGGEAPIHLAAAHPNGLPLVEATLGATDTRAAAWTTVEGRTPLFYALENGAAMIRRLGAAEVINRQETTKGWTALHMACMQYNLGAVRTLLDLQADPNLADRRELTPLYHLNLKYSQIMKGGAYVARKAELLQAQQLPPQFHHIPEARLMKCLQMGTEHFGSFAFAETDLDLGPVIQAIEEGAGLGGAALPQPLGDTASARLFHAAVLYRNGAAVRQLSEAGADPLDPRATTWDGHSAALWCEVTGNGLQRHFHPPTEADEAALGRYEAARRAHPDVELLDLTAGPERVPRDPPPGAPVPEAHGAEDLFPLHYRDLPELMDWLRCVGRHPTMWPLKSDYPPEEYPQGHPEGRVLNDPMGKLLWDARATVCAQALKGPLRNRPRAIFLFRLYTAESGLYRQSNEAMRTGKDLAFWRPFIYYIMQEMNLPEPGRAPHPPLGPRVAFRGLKVPLDAATYATFRPGATFSWEALTSTSTNFDEARSFMREMLCAIRVHTYEDIGQYSKFPDEEELLLPPGSKFAVVKLIDVPTHPQGLDAAQPLSPAELRSLDKVCVVLEQLKMPRLVPVPMNLPREKVHGKVEVTVTPRALICSKDARGPRPSRDLRAMISSRGATGTPGAGVGPPPHPLL